MIKTLLDAGLKLERVRAAFQYLREPVTISRHFNSLLLATA